jgi:predicted RNA-binding Zn-ribbon protein involved in translation (DUF1610 family)
MDISCPSCGETEALRGSAGPDGVIAMSCERCGHGWDRDPSPRCDQCGGTDLRAVPLAIVEKSRGTQLSIVGTRTVHLCVSCDAEVLDRWHRNRPNPLMPDQLPTTES